jgi:hypothetical protein
LTSDADQQKQSVSNWQTKLQGMATANKGVGCSTHDLCFLGERESPDSSTSSVRSALEDWGIITGFDELVRPAMQQHNDGVSPVLPTSMGRRYIASAASERRPVSTPALHPRDELLHQEKTDTPCQPQLAFATDLIHPSKEVVCIRMISESINGWEN